MTISSKVRSQELCSLCHERQIYAVALRLCHRCYEADYRRRQPEKKRESVRLWDCMHPKERREQHKSYKKRWKIKDPEGYKATLRRHHERRDMRKRNAYIEDVSKKRVWELSGGVCHLCKKKMDPKEFTLDHILPLSKGGKHEYKNVAAAHRLCNSVRRDVGPAQLRLYA